MQCPNCKMNVSEGASSCLHCGTQFQTVPNTPLANTNVDIAVSNPVDFSAQMAEKAVAAQEEVQEIEDRKKYQKIYLGLDYKRVTGRNFSWGVFFSGLTSVFGPIWFLIHGLFGQALKWFLTNLGIGFVYKVWGLLFSHSKLDRPFNFIIGVLLIALAIYYAKIFYSDYLEKVNYDINVILKTTQDENQRISMCRKKRFGLCIFKIPLLILLIIAYSSIIYLILWSRNYLF